MVFLIDTNGRSGALKIAASSAFTNSSDALDHLEKSYRKWLDRVLEQRRDPNLRHSYNDPGHYSDREMRPYWYDNTKIYVTNDEGKLVKAFDCLRPEFLALPTYYDSPEVTLKS